MSNKIRVPSHRCHKPTNQAVVTLSNKDVYLGAWGTAASKQKYRQLVAKWLLNNQRPPGSDLTIIEPVAKYWEHVERWYLKDGLPTNEQHLSKSALRPILFGRRFALCETGCSGRDSQPCAMC